MLSNLAGILFAFSNAQVLVSGSVLQIAINSSTVFVKDAAFGVASWLFSFRYWTIARAMPFSIAGENYPAKMLSEEKRLNTIFFTLNLLAPFVEGIGYLCADLFAIYVISFDGQYVAVGCKFAIGALQIVSAGFFCSAIFKIRGWVNAGDGTDQINLKILVTHLLAFALYLLSTVTLYIFFAIYYLGNQTSERLFLLFIAYAVSNILSFFEQLCLCNIFWELSVNDTRQDMDDFLPQVTGFDEEAEEQAAVWGQFIRKSTVVYPTYVESVQGPLMLS